MAEVTGSSCPNPNIFQFAAILSLIIGSGIVSVASRISVVALASTIISLILSGASFEAIGAAIASQVGALTSIEVVAYMIQGIKQILGC